MVKPALSHFRSLVPKTSLFRLALIYVTSTCAVLVASVLPILPFIWTQGREKVTIKWHVRTVPYLYIALWPLQFAMESPSFTEQTSCVSCYSRVCKCCFTHTRKWCLTADEKSWTCRNWETFILCLLFWGCVPGTFRPPGRYRIPFNFFLLSYV